MGSTSLEAHRRGIRIGGTDPKVSSWWIRTMHISLLPPTFRNPVMPGGIFFCEFLPLCLGECCGQWGGKQTSRVFQWVFSRQCIFVVFLGFSLVIKECGQVLLDRFSCLDGKTGVKRIQIPIPIHRGPTEIQF